MCGSQAPFGRVWVRACAREHLMAARAIVDALPFPIKDLTWENLPDVVKATGFAFSSACDLLKLVIGEPPCDLEAKCKICCVYCDVLRFAQFV